MNIWPQDGLPDNALRPRPTRQDYQDAAAFMGLRILDRPVEVGDLYLAGRNTGIKLLTASKIDPRHWVESVEGAYPYDCSECMPVEEIKQAA